MSHLPLWSLSLLSSLLLHSDGDNIGDIDADEVNCKQHRITSSLLPPAATALSCLEDLSGREDEDCIDCLLHEPCSGSGSGSGSGLATGLGSGHGTGINTALDVQGITFPNTFHLSHVLEITSHIPLSMDTPSYMH